MNKHEDFYEDSSGDYDDEDGVLDEWEDD